MLRGADQQFVIDIDFRPDVDMTSSNATPPDHVELLLFSSDRDDAKFDFFSVTRLQDGHIEFRFVSFVFFSFEYLLDRFYRAMHFSAKRGIAIACRLSVCP